ncbi:MAG: hypothetical protein Q8T08_01015 [Ignavibacteria bacterium]|nr:hypothetical protein [Ignavibacteria bacterium]
MQRKLLIMLISILGFSFQSIAQGNLLITPIRVVFEGNKQKEELNLANIGKDTAIYSISFVQKNMKEDGSFVNIEKVDSGQMFAEPYLRIFPRRVTLAPGEAQVVALQFRRKPDMAAGEYRSHLYFRSEKNYKPLGVENTDKDTTALSIQLIPIFGMSIPIIIRTGTVNVSAALSDLKLDIQQNTIQNLKLTIHRTGNISLYGDIIIQYVPVQGKPYQIGRVAGVGVYTNINKRYVVVKLNNTSGKPLTNGKLKVQYISKGETKKPVVYAEGELDI